MVGFFTKTIRNKNWLTIYIGSNGDLPYIELLSKTNVVVLPHSRQIKGIYSSFHNVRLFIGIYFSVEEKDIQHLNMLTYAEYTGKSTTISISSFHLI